MINSILLDTDNTIRSFFTEIATSLGYNLILVIALLVELVLIVAFIIKSAFSYELRIKRSLDKINNWLFKNKQLTRDNIKEFNDKIKKCPKRLVYYWQQFILFRDGDPTEYMSLDNLVEKPLRTSSFENNIRYLNVFTVLWSLIVLIFCCAYQSVGTQGAVNMISLTFVLFLPALVLIFGYIASFLLRSKKTSNLDEVYHIYHIFARFMKNACVTLPPFIDYDLLFDSKEIEKGNPQLREYYEARARKAKEEFEKAKQSDVEYVEYDFSEAGVDGSLVLERAMRESENFINKKTSTLAKIAHVDAEKEALRKNYENTQKDLQRKIQTTKENISKLLQRQEATTNRIEVGTLRKQQEQEINKQESLQAEYDQEETRYAVSNEELSQEILSLQNSLDELKDEVQKSMVAEYQTFYEKIMKFAYADAERRIAEEKDRIENDKKKVDQELIIVQTQIKRLIDENETLKVRLGQFDPEMAEKLNEEQNSVAQPGKYDEYGNYIYEDGSYHDPNGMFHDVDGKVYDMNGVLISENADAAADVAKAMAGENSNIKVEEYIPTEEENSTAAVEEYVQEEPQPIENPPVVTQEILPVVAEEQPNVEVTEGETDVPAWLADVIEQKQGEEIKEPEKKPSTRKKTTKIVENETPVEKPKAKRGRPRKIVVDETPKIPRKRGRPRKDDTQKLLEVMSEKEAIKNETTTKKPRPKTVVKKTTKAKKPTTTPRKKKTETTKTPAQTANNEKDLVSLAKINKMIVEEEERLSKMKALVNNEISDVISGKEREEINDEREEIIKSIEDLRKRAEQVKEGENGEEELANINKRLEELIGEIANLNKRSGN